MTWGFVSRHLTEQRSRGKCPRNLTSLSTAHLKLFSQKHHGTLCQIHWSLVVAYFLTQIGQFGDRRKPSAQGVRWGQYIHFSPLHADGTSSVPSLGELRKHSLKSFVFCGSDRKAGPEDARVGMLNFMVASASRILSDFAWDSLTSFVFAPYLDTFIIFPCFLHFIHLYYFSF